MSYKKKVALFGGAFDPVHAGHMSVAEYVLEKLPNEVDEIWFLPCYSDAFGVKDMSPPEHRVAMLELMLRYTGNADMKICTHEIETKNMAGTYSVVKSLKEIFPEIEFSFIIGADQAKVIRSWRNSRKLLRETKFIVVSRSGYLMATWSGKLPHKRLTQPLMSNLLSSTTIRKHYKKIDNMQNINVGVWLPKSVMAYIDENKLYPPEPVKGDMWLPNEL